MDNTSNNNIATVRTVAALTWATGIAIILTIYTELKPELIVFIQAASGVVISRVGSELQQTRSRWLTLIGDILLWIDKAPVYVETPKPE